MNLGFSVLVTGAKGFVGRNLCAQLNNIKAGKAPNYPVQIDEVFEYDLDSTPEELDRYCREADFVFNLAGVNRPENPEDFKKGNFGFASTLLDTLKKYNNTCPVMLSSSIQATLIGRYAGHPYGESKKAGEELFFDYAKETGAKVLVYRFPNLFGKWCRPNYNSAVATFCNNIANDLPIQVNDPSVELELLYIDDLVDEMILALQSKEHYCRFDGKSTTPIPCSTPLPCGEGRGEAFCYVPVTFKATLGEIVDLLHQFAALPQTLMIPEIPTDSFAKRLFSTYLSYLPKEKAVFDFKMNCDNRGSFTELVHTPNCGQVSINISKPGITKGQHWHNTKWEQFIVVKGHGLIQMRCLSPALSAREGEDAGRQKLANPMNYELLEENARKMRKEPTEAEAVMWQVLKGEEFGAKFRRQHVIGDYIVDFVDLQSGLVVEIDGEYHSSQEQRELDEQRTAWLTAHNFVVARFTNNEVLHDIDNVCSVIRNLLRHLADFPLAGGQRGAYAVSGEYIQSVIMLPGYTHNIINLSDTEDLVTVMYCNEIFDPNHPDTYFDPVK